MAGCPTYTLRFHNQSGKQQDFLCFQQKIDPGAPSALAWLSQPAADGTTIDFSWTETYDFMWMESGALTPGIQFTADQTVPADLVTANHIGLTFQNGVFEFTKTTDQGPKGSLTISQDSTIPVNEAVVGIGMAGSPTAVVPASPNINVVFTPQHPEYWITYGTFVPGQLIDTTNLGEPVQVIFPVNVYAMTATLDSQNKWTVKQGLV